MPDRIPMTPLGLAKLKEELRHLKEVERMKNVRDIEEARAHGDLRENAEYHAAKERQAFIEGRTREIEGTIALSEVIDPGKLSGSRVVFGATVKIEDTDTGEVAVYTIVGEVEADVKRGRISVSAPVARALIGRETGDVVTIRTGKGSREYQISSVMFASLED